MSHAEAKPVQSQGEQRSPLIGARVLIAASGTGGHLIPALHIAAALREADPRSVVEFIGAGRPLEAKIIDGAGYTRHVVASAGVKRRSIIGLAQFALRLPLGVLQTVRLFRSFKPDVVVGVGGYVSVLPVVLARLMGIPTWAHEAELHPGLANRVLGYFANTISVSFPDTHIPGGAALEYTGHPVRQELAAVERDEVRVGAPSRVLIIGGSQGARGLDQAVPHFAPLLAQRGVEALHQCRPESVSAVSDAYASTGVRATVVPFIEDMPAAYSWCDLVISRAGASSVAEISCVNRPAIFVPYPHQQGTHQTDNALALARLGKAVVVEETTPHFHEHLAGALGELLGPETFSAMKSAPSEARGLGAAGQIAAGVLRIARRQGDVLRGLQR